MPSTNAYIFRGVVFLLEGDDDYRCQVTKAEITSNPNIVQESSLCGPQSAVGTPTFSLELEGFQNWFNYSSLVMYLNNNGGKEASFRITWTSPDGTDSIRADGTAIIVPPGFGGTAEELATFSVSLPMQGAPTYTRTVGS